MYNSFELFFSGAFQARWWRLECLIFFACGWIETVVLKKQHCDRRVDCKKCDRKKTTVGLIVRRQAKRLCKPCASTCSASWRERVRVFACRWFCTAELPVV